jgi:IMP dehydrogenase
MDTVTEVQMAIEMARNGGLGIIHRFQTIKEQASMVEQVKRAEAFTINDPITIWKEATVKQLRELIKKNNINTFIVVNEKPLNENKLDRSPLRKQSLIDSRETVAGIITNRDLKHATSENQKVKEIMTKREHMTVYESSEENPKPVLADVQKLLFEKRIEKMPIVDKDNVITGLITLKDLQRGFGKESLSNQDKEGRLVVGAAIGAKDDYLERSQALIDAGCDVLVVDIANGHSQLCIDTVKILKQKFPTGVDIVAGSVATGEGARLLIEAGADGIRCGIGNGSICITRIVAGSGVPQLSALIDVAPVCKEYDIPLISDGGNKNSGNMCKALAAGASCIMLGRLVAGCEESPSKVIYRDGKLCKVYRGMAGYGANVSKAQRLGDQEPGNKTFTPEGVEGYIAYAGPLKDVVHQFVSGIKSGMSYSGAHNIDELQEKAKFIKLTSSGITESGVHGINKI